MFSCLCQSNKSTYQAKDTRGPGTQHFRDFMVCSPDSFVIQKYCYTFNWCNNFEIVTLERCQAIAVSVAMIPSFYQPVFEAMPVTNHFPPLLVAHNSTTVQKVIFERFLSKLQHSFETYRVQNSTLLGFYPCSHHKKKVDLGLTIHYCRFGSYVSSDSMSDGVTDCPHDNSDEELIPKYAHCQSKRDVCCNLYFRDLKGNCQKYKPAENGTEVPKTHSMITIDPDNFTCKTGRKIDWNLVDDLVFDCELTGDDEPILRSLIKKEANELCQLPDTIPCLEGHSHCYKITVICTYSLNKNNALIPCRNGGHLQKCTLFECNAMFKCTESYCLPWAFVCDGKWDCPDGDDEQHNEICSQDYICNHMYKCRNTTQTCLHVGNVCDGKYDCPLQDDEQFCHMKIVQCPLKCNCLLLAILCVHVPKVNIKEELSNFPHFESVSLFSCILSSLQELHHLLQNARVVKLSRNNITEIGNGLPLLKILYLDLDFNCVKLLQENCMVSFYLLSGLNLANNHISSIQPDAFYNLSLLKFLNLSNNPLLFLPEKSLKFSAKLTLLFVVNISTRSVHVDAFSDSRINLIISTDYHLCCVSPQATLCPTHKTWYISCSNVLPTGVFTNVFLSVSGVVFCLSCISILLYLLMTTFDSFRMSVVSINTNDMLLCVYLTIIWVADIILKDKFILKDEVWSSSSHCFAAFGLVFCHTIQGLNLIMFLSLSRLMIVIHPMNTKFKQSRFVFKTISLSYFVSLVLSVLVTLIVKFTHLKLTTSLCLPFVDPSGSVMVIRVITWIIIVSQIATSLLIIILHVVLIISLKESQKSVQRSSGDTSNSSVIIQLVIATSSNILCWFPADGVYLAAMFLPAYPVDLIFWTTVMVLPFNSTINPVVFLLSALRRHFKSRPTQVVK